MLPKGCGIVKFVLILCYLINNPIFMKNLMFVLAMIFSGTMVYAQACSSTCTKKNSYVKNGDQIEAIIYHDNGVVAQTGNYTSDNKLEGEWISFDNEGNKTAVANYSNGIKVGTWLFYQGSQMKEVTYTNTSIAEVKTYAITGTRVVTNKP
jgi:antitoxin component YwqK of YwqJK toxin-antitoxin module